MAMAKVVEELLEAYDSSEVTVLQVMMAIMITEDGCTSDDFDGLTFTDIESMFLDEFGHPDFRPASE